MISESLATEQMISAIAAMGHEQENGLCGSVSQYGEPYLTIINGRHTPEGECHTVFCATADDAIEKTLVFFKDLAMPNPQRIVWRIKPELSVSKTPTRRLKDSINNKWKVYMRLHFRSLVDPVIKVSE